MTSVLELKEKEKEKYEGEYISLCSDTTFKYLMKNKNTRYFFYEVLNKITGYDINEYTMVDNEDNTGNKRKDFRMDIILEKDNVMIIVEMNNNYYPGVEEKSKEYLHRKAGRYFYEGEKYDKLYTIGVFFNNYCCKECNSLSIGEHVMYEKNTNLIDNTFKYYQIYLPNYKKVSYNSSRLDKRLSAFLCESYEELEEVLGSDDKIIVDTLKSLSEDEEFMNEYEREIMYQKEVNTAKEGWKEIGLEEGRKLGIQEGIRQGIEQGIQQGIQQGINQTNCEIAKVMLEKGIDIKLISEITKLSVEEIKAFK